MLNINPDTVCFLITRAREFHAKEEVVIPETADSPADDWGRQVLADHANDETLQEFNSTISDLEPDQQVELVALMWVGRGDYDSEQWDDAVSEARDNWNKRTAEYLIGTPLVANYLQDGLEQFDYSCDT